MTITLATFEDFDRKLSRALEEHLRAYKVSDTLFRVVSDGSRQYVHRSRKPHLRRGLRHTKRKWHFITALRLSNGHVRLTCNGEHCVFVRDSEGSTVCKHSMVVARRLLRRPAELNAVLDKV